MSFLKNIALYILTVSILVAQPVRNAVLDPEQTIDLPVSSEITTVVFPGAVIAVAGADMLIDQGKEVTEPEEGAPPRFHVSHAPNSNFILVRSLQPEASGRLTAIFEGSAYVLQLRAVASNSVASLIFKQPLLQCARQVDLPPDPVKFSPRIGLSLLDRARAYPILAKSMPRAVEGVSVCAQSRKTDLPNLEITVEEVYRFSKEDAVVFVLKVRNKTDGIVDLAPKTFAARVAQERFDQSIANGPRSLAPGEIADAEFAIVGMADGTRNDLRADNAFTILVDCARRGAAPAGTHLVQPEPSHP